MRRLTPALKTARKTLYHVFYGIWGMAFIVIAAGVWWVRYPFEYVFGEILGSIIASLLMIWLYRSIDAELDLGEDKAIAHARLNSILRTVVEMTVVVGSFFITAWVNPITLLIGLFGRKIAALMVPVIFERERTGRMLAEDEAEMIRYGRLLTKSEREDEKD